MRKFQITKIKLENIKTYVYEEIDFSEGNNVLIGENGAGKSTILESIYLSIFGETVPGRRLVDMIRYGEKQGKITLHFNVGDESFRIEDEITKKDEEHAVQKLDLVNESLEQTIADGRSALRIKIEEMLNIDAITFSNAIYASQGEIGKIIISKESDRKKLFDRLFQIDQYEKAWGNLSKVERIINNQIKSLKQQKNMLEDDIKQLPTIKTNVKEKEEQLDKEKNELTELKNTFKEIDEKYTLAKEYQEEYNKLIGERNQLKNTNNELKQEVNRSCKILEKSKEIEEAECSLPIVKKVEKKISSNLEKISTELKTKREKEKNIAINLEKIKEKQFSLSTLEETIADNKTFYGKELEKYTSEIDELTKDISKWNEVLPIILEKTDNRIKSLKSERKSIEKISDEITRIKTELKSLEETSDRYNGNIVRKRLFLSNEAGDRWKEIIDEYAKIDFEKEINSLEKKIEELENSKKILDDKKSAISNNLERIKNDLEHLKSLNGEKTCPTCKQNLSQDTLDTLNDNLSKEKKAYCEEKKSILKKIEDLEVKLLEKKERVKELTQKEQLFSKIKPTFDDLYELEKDKEKIDQKSEKTEEKLSELKEQYSIEIIEELDEKIENHEDKQRSIKSALKNVGNLIDLTDKIEEDNQKYQSLKEEVKQLKTSSTQQQLDALRGEIEELEANQEKIDRILDEIKNILSKLNELENNNKKISVLINKLEKIESYDEFSQKETIETNWTNTKERLSSIQTSIKNLVEEIIPPLVEQKKQLEKKEKDLKKFEKELELENKKKEITSILRSLMRELPERLLPNYILKINNTSTEILKSIIPESDIQGIMLNDDYSINIIRSGNIEDITVLSGGETVIVALALRLAFAKEFSSIDLLILDEPTVFLDERRRGELVSVLEINRLVGQMFVVTHDPDFEKISDKTHFINKSNGISKIHKIKDDEGSESLEDIYNLKTIELE